MRRPRSPALASVLAAVVLLALAVAPADGFVGVRPAGAAVRVRLNQLVGGVVLHVLVSLSYPCLSYAHAHAQQQRAAVGARRSGRGDQGLHAKGAASGSDETAPTAAAVTGCQVRTPHGP